MREGWEKENLLARARDGKFASRNTRTLWPTTSNFSTSCWHVTTLRSRADGREAYFLCLALMDDSPKTRALNTFGHWHSQQFVDVSQCLGMPGLHVWKGSVPFEFPSPSDGTIAARKLDSHTFPQWDMQHFIRLLRKGNPAFLSFSVHTLRDLQIWLKGGELSIGVKIQHLTMCTQEQLLSNSDFNGDDKNWHSKCLKS